MQNLKQEMVYNHESFLPSWLLYKFYAILSAHIWMKPMITNTH